MASFALLQDDVGDVDLQAMAAALPAKGSDAPAAKAEPAGEIGLIGPPQSAACRACAGKAGDAIALLAPACFSVLRRCYECHRTRWPAGSALQTLCVTPLSSHPPRLQPAPPLPAGAAARL